MKWAWNRSLLRVVPFGFGETEIVTSIYELVWFNKYSLLFYFVTESWDISE